MLTIEKGDFGFKLTFTCKKADGTAFDLTSYTAVKFNVWEPGVPGTKLVEGACVVTNAVGGICEYTVASGDFDTAGEYRAEIQATATGVKESFIPFGVSVVESA